MAFGVFIHKPDGGYDDFPSERYQFPGRYLNSARQCEGDWIIYLEPRRASRSRGYFAVAKVQKIEEDTRYEGEGMFRALIEPGTYLEFGNLVPFSENGNTMERGLLNEKGELSGRKQLSIRTLSSSDFAAIIERGLERDEDISIREDASDISDIPHLPFRDPRLRVLQLTNRPVRDRNFRKAVMRAYNNTCAITGLRFVNDGKHAEADAAHIMPVWGNGPDIVSNGIALSRTAHWMFDRGLLGLNDDLKIMVSRQNNNRAAAQSIINNSGKLRLPRRISDRPRAEFVAWHREHIFKH